MKSKALILTMVTLTFLMSVTPILGEQVSNDWAVVTAIGADEKVSVELKDGKKFKGLAMKCHRLAFTTGIEEVRLAISRQDSIARLPDRGIPEENRWEKQH